MNINLLLILVPLKISIVLNKALDETERNTRANFIQRLLNKRKNSEGRVRLVGGPNRYEGNVYIYHAGRWGAICDDSWDDAGAAVVCRQYNRTGYAKRGSAYGLTLQKYWMDDVTCEGNEILLNQCVFSGWGFSDCDVTEAAGAVCREKKRDEVKKIEENGREKKKKVLFEVLDVENASLRIVGGNNTYEGRVEMYHNSVWGSLCPDGWTLYEAAAVCRHLALGHAVQALQTDIFGSTKIVLSGVMCEGNETNLFSCRHQQFGNVVCPSNQEDSQTSTDQPPHTAPVHELTQDPAIVLLNHIKGHVAAVVCSHKLADLALDSSAIERSAHLQDVPMYLLQCAMEENCLSKSAYEIQKSNPNWQHETRRLLRFTASSLNIGNDEFRPYLPKHLWQWHLCHMHYHSMEVFATFDVLDAEGRRIAEGHKASFCLEDNTCLPGVDRKYSCKNYGDQGISVNCSDVYQYNVDCQWVDVTDVPLGDYTFKVAVNPHARVAEQQYHNNAARCNLRITDTYASVYGCNLERP